MIFGIVSDHFPVEELAHGDGKAEDQEINRNCRAERERDGFQGAEDEDDIPTRYRDAAERERKLPEEMKFARFVIMRFAESDFDHPRRDQKV